MKNNPLKTVQEFGQSIWQDYIRRKMILSGELRQMIEKDGIRGVTSNPAIFEKVIDGSHDYDDDISAMALQGLPIEEIYESLTVADVQMAADLFRPLYDDSDGKHGFVSLEVNPHLARDVDGTLTQARHLWQALDRPNVMIKVPATIQGLTCIRCLISEGINVNVTLLFGLPRYREVTEAFISGLEARAEAGRPLHAIASVASFFLSRIDVLLDPKLKAIKEAKRPERDLAGQLYGQVAIASAKCAYQIYKDVFEDERFSRLADKGARAQRLLWASTSTKEPEFSDIKYVEALIGPDTINTLPRKTIEAYRHHGLPAQRLTRDLERARTTLKMLERLDININQVSQTLEDQGIEKFVKPYDSSLVRLEKGRKAALRAPIDRQVVSVTSDTDGQIKNRLAQLQHENFNRRLWEKDASLWRREAGQTKSAGMSLGWLEIVPRIRGRINALIAFRNELLEEGFRYVLLMGMGGSSLAPMVFQRCFPAAREGQTLFVLDAPDPVTVRRYTRLLPLARTLFIVASKSGTTVETMALGDYYFNQLERIKGTAAGTHFVAITDEGSPLADLAQERKYRRTFLNFEDIGSSYSALSYVGMVPAALMGLDISEMTVRAQRMLRACAADRTADKSPGVVLGAALGELARQGCDKITFLMPPSLSALGMWLEKLLAESTGKAGAGLMPVAGEPPVPPTFYGADRVFVHFSLDYEPDERLARSVSALQEAGWPVIAIKLQDRLDLAQEFIRWEVAAAAAGAVLGIDPFDQPGARESRGTADRLLEFFGLKGQFPDNTPQLVDGSLQLYLASGSAELTVGRTLARFFEQVRSGDYISLLAYLTEEAAIDSLLEGIRLRLRQQFKTAVTTGYGPRYLYATGQYQIGGPNKGFFILLTCDEPRDVEIPGRPYGFGVLRQAQALGDLETLDKHGRRVLRLHLGSDPARGLAEFKLLLEKVLPGLE